MLICYLYVDMNRRTHLGKDALVGLLEEGGVEAVPHDHVTACEVAAGAHLQQSRLVQRTRVQVWVGGNTTCRNQSMKTISPNLVPTLSYHTILPYHLINKEITRVADPDLFRRIRT